MSKIGFVCKLGAYLSAVMGIISLGGRVDMWEWWIIMIAMALNGIISSEGG